jgi:dipeptidyl aminopeptidase/acylaminoacyl peptidase
MISGLNNGFLMRTILFILLFSIVFVFFCSERNSSKKPDKTENEIQSGIPPIPDSITDGIRKYQNTRSANLAGWLSNGNGIVIQTRFAETNQLHVVYTPGGARNQKTFRPEEVIDASVCPDSTKNLVVFSQDSGGNEQFQLHAIDIATMKSQLITDGHSSNGNVVWSNRGDRFSFTSTKRNGKDWDIYLCNADSAFTVSLVQEVEGMYSVLDWSPDDSRLLVQRYLSSTISQLYIIDIPTKAMRPLKNSPGKASIEEAVWDNDGRGVFYTSDETADTRTLCYFNSADQKETIITGNIHWEIRYLSISRDRSYLLFTTNEHGYLGVYILDTKTLKYRKLDFLPKGIIGSFHFHPYKNILGCVIRDADLPGDVFTVDLDKSSIQRWTYSEYGELDSGSLVKPEIITFPTFDSVENKPRMIPAFLYKPSGNGPFPVLLFIHGGPETQYWPSFSPFIQYIINELRIAVIAPNVRGSGGYGKTYLELDNTTNREDAVKDIGALLNWIRTQTDLDSSRMAVMGGSYGGYMSLSSLIQYNDQFKAGIDLYGISNFVTFLESTASYRRDLRRVEYGDERDPAMREYFRKISPVNNASKIKAPLLIIQGANDPRVPLSESEQIAAAVRKNGKPVWMLVASDEGHGFRKKGNKEYQDCVTVLFLKKFLVPIK